MNPFESNKVLKSVADVKRLAGLLSHCREVTRFGDDPNEEAWGLADSLAEIEGAMQEFLNVQLPRLTNEKLSAVETSDLLLDIGESFRRILYHILEQQDFYRYLVPQNMHVYGAADNDGREGPKEPS